MSDRPRTNNLSRRGFTLTELLVVIGAIVLMIALAVPLFNVMSGSGSIEGGQNMASAMLQRARARAIAMQERRGVLFFEDQVTRKTGMLLVKIDEPNYLILDPWGVPLLYIPPAGAANMQEGGVTRTATGTGPTAPKQAPDRKGYFLSAGEDRNFAAGDDNLYTFENK